MGMCSGLGGAVPLGEAAMNDCGGTVWYASLLQLPTKEKEMVGNGTLS